MTPGSHSDTTEPRLLYPGDSCRPHVHPMRPRLHGAAPRGHPSMPCPVLTLAGKADQQPGGPRDSQGPSPPVEQSGTVSSLPSSLKSQNLKPRWSLRDPCI